MSVSGIIRSGPRTHDLERALDRMAASLTTTAVGATGDIDPELVRTVLATLDVQDQHVLWAAYVDPNNPEPEHSPAPTRRIRKAERALALGLAVAYARASSTLAPDCQTARARLGQFVRHRLRPTQRLEMERHLLACEDCLRAFVNVRQAGRKLRAIAPLLLAGRARPAPATASGLFRPARGALRRRISRLLRRATPSTVHGTAFTIAVTAGIVAITAITTTFLTATAPNSPGDTPHPPLSGVPGAPGQNPTHPGELLPDQPPGATDDIHHADKLTPSAPVPGTVPPTLTTPPPTDSIPPGSPHQAGGLPDHPGTAGDGAPGSALDTGVGNADAAYLHAWIPPSGPDEYWIIELQEPWLQASDPAHISRLGLLNEINSQPLPTPAAITIEAASGELAPQGTWLIRNHSETSQHITLKYKPALPTSVTLRTLAVPPAPGGAVD